MHIRKFNEDILKKGNNNDINHRYDLNKTVFNIALQSLKNKMIEDFDKNQIGWVDIASLSHINETLINLMETWDEEGASKLREMLKY